MALKSAPRNDRDRASGLLGLAARAGRVVAGTRAVREAARRGRLDFVVVAADASANAREKLIPLLRATGVPHAEALDRATLGAALGRARLSAVGLTDEAMATRLREIFRAAAG
ncbi:MAG: L7Ae/L30e/S12e/Gadd45 family ribosomal protein [Gemmatimonadota bacterium]